MKKTLLFAALAVFSMSCAQAYDRFEESDDGGGTIYGGVSFGRTANAECLIDGVVMDCDDSNWKLYGGYEITSNLAVEAAYHSILKNKGLDVTGMSASGLYNVPVANNIKAFGKAGFIAWESVDGCDNSSSCGDDTDFLLGAGATYKFSENWGVRGEYEHIGGDADADMYSIGAVLSTM